MSIDFSFKNERYTVEKLFIDRDSLLLDPNKYWTRIVASIAQLIAEKNSTNWLKFNLIRTNVIKALGVNIQTEIIFDSALINILPLSDISVSLSSTFNNFLEKNIDDLNFELRGMLNTVFLENNKYFNESKNQTNINWLLNLLCLSQITVLTNDLRQNAEDFFHDTGIKGVTFIPQINKSCLESLLNGNSMLITSNEFLAKLYKNSICVQDLNDITVVKNHVDKVVVNIDGASRGNPGHSSIGIVILVNDSVVCEYSEYIGQKTNNHAEYTALIRSLELCQEKGYKNIEIKSDSELVVKQINGEYRVKDSDIKILFDRACSLIKDFGQCKISHIPREENKKADKLANDAFKNQSSITI